MFVSQLVSESATKGGAELAPSQEAQQELAKTQEELKKTQEELNSLKEEVQKKLEEVILKYLVDTFNALQGKKKTDLGLIKWEDHLKVKSE